MSLIKNKFAFFNFLHAIVLVFALSRSISAGFITYYATSSAKELGIIAALLSLGSFLGYYFVKKIKKHTSMSYSLLFVMAQAGFISSSVFLISYLYYNQLFDSWGNYLVWGFYSAVVGFFISMEIRVKNYMLKERFEKASFSSIVKYDFLILGIGKFLGFATGYFISNPSGVYFFMTASILTNLMILLYVLSLPKVKELKNISTENKKIATAKYSIDFKTTLLLGFAVNFLIFPLGTQAVTYSKFWGQDFYIYLMLSALGGILFNIAIGSRQLVFMKRKYSTALTFYLIALLFLMINNAHLALIAMFLYGCSLFMLNSIAQARMYEASIDKPYLADRYFPVVSVANIAGSYLFGKGLSISPFYTFFSLFVLSLFVFLYLKKADK